MPRFFLSHECFAEGASTVTIDGENARHISLSLRMKVGDPLTLCDGQGREYSATINAMTSTTVSAEIGAVTDSPNESPIHITLYQGIAKGDKMDSIVQKAVELGVHEIVPVDCKRSIAKIDAASAAKKVARWQKIADEAAGQCGRGLLPKVHMPLKFCDAVDRAAADELSLICYEKAGTKPLTLLLPADPPKTLSFFIGPEGGFEGSEVELAEGENVLAAGLGRRILRTETASSFVLSALTFAYEMPILLKI